MEWQQIDTAPRDGTEIIVLLCPDGATPIVRTAWWDDEDGGWWSYRHNVTQERLDGYDRQLCWMPCPKAPPGVVVCGTWP